MKFGSHILIIPRISGYYIFADKNFTKRARGKISRVQRYKNKWNLENFV